MTDEGKICESISLNGARFGPPLSQTQIQEVDKENPVTTKKISAEELFDFELQSIKEDYYKSNCKLIQTKTRMGRMYTKLREEPKFYGRKRVKHMAQKLGVSASVLAQAGTFSKKFSDSDIELLCAIGIDWTPAYLLSTIIDEVQRKATFNDLVSGKINQDDIPNLVRKFNNHLKQQEEKTDLVKILNKMIKDAVKFSEKLNEAETLSTLFEKLSRNEKILAREQMEELREEIIQLGNEADCFLQELAPILYFKSNI